MKIAGLLCSFMLLSIISYSQTKRIAHRSHSGSDKHFFLLNSAGNFGLPPERDSVRVKVKKNAPKKDTIKAPVIDSTRSIPLAALKEAELRKLYGVFLGAKDFFNL